MKRLPLVIKFDRDDSPSWAEFRRVWDGQRVTLITDDGQEHRGELDGFTVSDRPGHEVFVLRVEGSTDWTEVVLGADSVVKALC